MPTGYTAAIKDGITFEQFAMSCARAFGALVMMRDEPSSAEIPERFEPSTHHAEKLAEAEKNLAWYQNMADSEAAREAEKEFNKRSEQHSTRMQEILDLQNKYNEMLAKVVNWKAPTPAHDDMKQFMIDQIQQSIDFDCGTKYLADPQRLSASEWRAEKIGDSRKDIAYHAKAHREEVERTESRNAWIKALRESLKSA